MKILTKYLPLLIATHSIFFSQSVIAFSQQLQIQPTHIELEDSSQLQTNIEIANKQLADLSEDECTSETVLRKLFIQSLDRRVKLLKNSYSVLSGIKKLTRKITDRKKSFNEQLSPKASGMLSQDLQRINAMKMVRIVESNYQRDITAIENLTKAADSYYQNGKIPRMKEPDAFYFRLLLIWRKFIATKLKDENFSFKECNIDFALGKKEIKMELEIEKSSDQFFYSMNRYDQIMYEYNMKKIDYDKLNVEDRNEILQLRENVFLPMDKKNLYVKDIENIRHFAKISKFVYESNLNDILYSGGNYEAVGSSIENLIKNHKLDKIDVTMLVAWRLLNEKMPSDAVKIKY